MTKIIIQCPKCKHQYGVHEKRVGEKFHCFCGELLGVPSVKIHDAAVVRCSSCGGSRGKDNEPNCQYCGSSFTLHERDLNTICPNCMCRISSKAKFCHSCSTAIVADDDFESTTMPCPSCDNSHLHSRKMTHQAFTLKECNHCAGLWISIDVFNHLEQQAQLQAASGIQNRVDDTKKYQVDNNSINPKQYYRKCPKCSQIMNRKNYAGDSGIVVDVCSKHGMWFDIHELDQILTFIRSGHLLKSQQKSVRKAKLNKKPLKKYPTQSSTQVRENEKQVGIDVFSDLIGWLFD